MKQQIRVTRCELSHVAQRKKETVRRCVLTGESLDKQVLIRLVPGPDGIIVPDVAAKLPGRGVWVSADGAALEAAAQNGQLRRAISRSLKTGLDADAVPSGLRDQITGLLRARSLSRLGLLNRAGAVVTGEDKIKAALMDAPDRDVALVISASDASDGGADKIAGLVRKRAPHVRPFDRDALSLALGRDNVVHVLIWAVGGTQELTADLSRLEGLRN